MSNEKGFVDSLIKTIRNHQGADWTRASDNFNLGLPDLVFTIVSPVHGCPNAFAIEAKQISPLMKDPFHRGRRTGMMLKHTFTGPQISNLKSKKASGVHAFGLIRVSIDMAFSVEPEDIPRKNGNFTHEELVKFGTPVFNTKGEGWDIWRKYGNEILSTRHRNDS